MVTVAAQLAQAQLPDLLDKVVGGEAVLITRGGKAIARLVAAEETPSHDVAAAMAAAKALLAGRDAIGGPPVDWRSLRDEGRR